VREGGQDIWWRRTGRLAALVVAATVAFAASPLLLPGVFSGRSLLGLPLGWFVFAEAVPIVALIAVFWLADRQRTFDHRYDVTGTES
jgi:putative solute:sodium symporter small subunit